VHLRGDRVAAVSGSHVSGLRSYPVPVEVIPKGVDWQFLTPNDSGGEPRAGFRGRFVPQKDPLEAGYKFLSLFHFPWPAKDLPWTCSMWGLANISPAPPVLFLIPNSLFGLEERIR
jgi:hypothetical protein